MSRDQKWLVGSVIGTGGAIATLLLALAGLIVQQNATANARFDDVHQRFDDVHRRIDDVQSEIDELRTEVRSDIRELRALVIEALKRTDPTD